MRGLVRFCLDFECQADFLEPGRHRDFFGLEGDAAHYASSFRDDRAAARVADAVFEGV